MPSCRGLDVDISWYRMHPGNKKLKPICSSASPRPHNRYVKPTWQQEPPIQMGKSSTFGSPTPKHQSRARYAGKVKRLLLEQGAAKDKLQVEFATGTLWYQGRRIASAIAHLPRKDNRCRGSLGWIDAEAVGNFTKKSKGNIVVGTLCWSPCCSSDIA